MTFLNGGTQSPDGPIADDHSFILRAAKELEQQPQKKPPTVAEELLREVIGVIQQRRENYGPPREHFRRTVALINALFAHKLKEPFTESEWAQIMICDKLSRHQEKPIWDTPVDIAGYSATMGECLKCE